jgi:hypothetical protein
VSKNFLKYNHNKKIHSAVPELSLLVYRETDMAKFTGAFLQLLITNVSKSNKANSPTPE